MNVGNVLFAFAMLMLALSFIPVFSDPYHAGSGCVDFWTWASRELGELVSGER